jgi:hypothetical protein
MELWYVQTALLDDLGRHFANFSSLAQAGNHVADAIASRAANLAQPDEVFFVPSAKYMRADAMLNAAKKGRSNAERYTSMLARLGHLATVRKEAAASPDGVTERLLPPMNQLKERVKELREGVIPAVKGKGPMGPPDVQDAGQSGRKRRREMSTSTGQHISKNQGTKEDPYVIID